MSRRLQAEASDRRGRSGRHRAVREDSPLETPDNLPEYEPPAFTMSGAVRREITNISTHPDELKGYERHIKLSAKYLPRFVGTINDRLYLRRSTVEQRANKRKEKGMDKTEADEELERTLCSLEAEIPAVSVQAEAAMRDVIDRQHDLDDTRAALRDAVTSVRAQPPQPPDQATGANQERSRPKFEDIGDIDEFLAGFQEDGADEPVTAEDDGENMDVDDDNGGEGGATTSGNNPRNRRPPQQGGKPGKRGGPPPGPLDFFHKSLADRNAAYARNEPYRKYALDNDYVSLKRQWYDALHPDNDRGLPDPSRWFRPDDGEPVLDFGASGGGGGGRAGDDDVVIERETISFVCPITQLPLKEPFTSRKCKHTFEKAAIVAHFRALDPPEEGGPKRGACPLGGCAAILQLNDFEVDQHMIRKIERAKQRERNRVDEEDDDFDADEGSMLETASRNLGRNVKKERAGR